MNYPEPPIQQLKQASVYERHEQAVRDWHNACRNFAEAQAMREKTAQILKSISDELITVMQSVQYDPTQPQPAQPPMNGCLVGGSNSRPY